MSSGPESKTFKKNQCKTAAHVKDFGVLKYQSPFHDDYLLILITCYSFSS